MVAPLTAERTLELAAQNWHIVDQTRSLIAINRRWLNPWLSISGGAEADNGGGTLFLSVRSRLERGVLVPAPDRVWPGPGTGKTCVICTQGIYSDEVQNETSVREGDVAIKLWVHNRCFGVWRWASGVFEAEQRPSAT